MPNRLVKQRKAPNAILRKLIQPLYDTNVFRGSGGGAFQLLQYFSLPIGGALPVIGGVKSEADTNLTQASQLGTPQKFDLEGFNFEFFVLEPDDIDDTAPDLVNVYEQSVFTFFFGNSRPWLELPLSRIPSGTMLTGTAASGDIANDVEFGFLHQGDASVKEYYDFTVKRKPIRIGTAEPFSAEITWPNGAITMNTTNNQRARCYLVGKLYSAL